MKIIVQTIGLMTVCTLSGLQAQPLTDSAQEAYLEKSVHDIALRAVTDTVKLGEFYSTDDYTIKIDDEVDAIVGQNSKDFSIIISDGAVREIGGYYKDKKHGLWFYPIEDGNYIIEVWKKGKLETRNVFLRNH